MCPVVKRIDMILLVLLEKYYIGGMQYHSQEKTVGYFPQPFSLMPAKLDSLWGRRPLHDILISRIWIK